MASIVVGVDGSRDADAALRWATEEAWLRGDRLDVILSWSPDDCPREVLDRAYTPGPHTIEGTALQVLQERVRRARDPRRPVPVTEKAMYEDAVEALLAASAGADMLVVGRRGSGRLRRYLVGSVAAACLHQAGRPVVVVRADDGPPAQGPPRPVLVGVDGSAASLTALRWAAQEAALHASPLHVVSAWLPMPTPWRGRGADRGEAALERAARDALDACVAKGLTDVPDLSVETRLAFGGAAAALLAAAADAQLLVLGARGRAASPGCCSGRRPTSACTMPAARSPSFPTRSGECPDPPPGRRSGECPDPPDPPPDRQATPGRRVGRPLASAPGGVVRIVDEAELARRTAAHLGGVAASPERSSSPLVVASGNYATPLVALHALDAAVDRYRLFMINAQVGIPVRPGVIPQTPFVGPGMRDAAGLDYLPSRLSLVPRLLATTHRPDVVVLHTSLPAGNRVSLGTEVNILPAAIEAARERGGLVVAQLNPRMPYTFGDGEVSLDQVDLAVEVDQPLATPTASPVDDVRGAIGQRVAALVEDGAVLQLGIGAVPDATLSALTRRRNLRVWTETFSDGMLELEQAGALAAAQPLHTSFLFGSARLYAWAHRNPRLRLLRTEAINDPAAIARLAGMTSINTALQVDLHAQANASWIRGRVHSGFGGQPDFVVGALHAPGGRAIVALPSRHAGSGASCVLPVLPGPVTSFQHSYLISENGTAAVWGRAQHEQAEQIIDHVAHPEARPGLVEAAGGLGLLSYGRPRG
jgi:nucleotide-binding universal stress UspA family protein